MNAGHDMELAARGLTDGRDRLLSADEPLADLQERCGGAMLETLAVPELLDLVRQSRIMGLRIAREFSAFDGEDLVRGFARINPLEQAEGGGCEVLIEHWLHDPQSEADEEKFTSLLDEVDRATAEITARLDHQQRVQLWGVVAPDAQELQTQAVSGQGHLWTQQIELIGIAHHQPMHWRLLDGAQCKVPGSNRSWRARLMPIGGAQQNPKGFELLLVPDQPLAEMPQPAQSSPNQSKLIGSALTPVLRQPIARIVANAETIRARLAGPLREEYSERAGNIVSAGQHLGGMLDDLADLEAVETPGFSTLNEAVDLGDVARRAAGILGVRAQNRSITISTPSDETEDAAVASAEFRRVLQIAINLIGNAIAYSPDSSKVTISVVEQPEGLVAMHVSDQGPGVTAEQAERIFDKFERLGRDNDGGSGLGLYISRRLARAMGGDLTLVPRDSEGAEFRLELPGLDKAKGAHA